MEELEKFVQAEKTSEASSSSTLAPSPSVQSQNVCKKRKYSIKKVRKAPMKIKKPNNVDLMIRDAIFDVDLKNYFANKTPNQSLLSSTAMETIMVEDDEEIEEQKINHNVVDKSFIWTSKSAH